MLCLPIWRFTYIPISTSIPEYGGKSALAQPPPPGASSALDVMSATITFFGLSISMPGAFIVAVFGSLTNPKNPKPFLFKL